MSYDAIVEEALVRKGDAESSKILLSPRKEGSAWFKPNQERVAPPRKKGALAPAGEAAVSRAKRNGTWTLLDDVEAPGRI